MEKTSLFKSLSLSSTLDSLADRKRLLLFIFFSLSSFRFIYFFRFISFFLDSFFEQGLLVRLHVRSGGRHPAPASLTDTLQSNTSHWPKSDPRIFIQTFTRSSSLVYIPRPWPETDSRDDQNLTLEYIYRPWPEAYPCIYTHTLTKSLQPTLT